MLSLDKMHFSAKNSFLSILKKNNNITLNTVYTGNLVSITQIICSDILSEEFLPWELKFTTKCGEHKLCLFGNDGICIRGKGEAITLEYIYVPNVYTANFVCQNKNTLKLCDCYTDTFHILTVQKGTLSVDTKKRPQAVYMDYIRITVLPDANGEYEFTFCISTKELPAFSIRTYDEYSALMKNDYMGRKNAL